MESKAVPLEFSPRVKDRPWMKGMTMNISKIASSSTNDKKRDLLCQRYYDGNIDDRDFDYLRKIDEYEMPAKVRHIPIVRQNINHLVSQEARRGFNFRAYPIDEDSLRNRLDKKAEDYIKVINENFNHRAIMVQAEQERLNQQRQQLDVLMSRPAANREEQIQMDALKKAYPTLMQELKMAEMSLAQEIYITKKDTEKIEKYYNYEYSDFVQMKGNSLLKYAAKSTDVGMKYQLKNGFTDRLVNGKELYMVDLIEGNKFPVFKRVHSNNVYWSGDGENERVEDGQWVAIKYMMSPSSIIEWFGQHLSNKDMAKLATYQSNINYGEVYSTAANGAVFNDPGSNDLYGGTKLLQGIEVWWVYWKSSRKVDIKHTPNKYLEGKYHRHFMDEDADDADRKVNEEKGEFLESRYIDDVYEGVQIGRDIFTNLGRRPVQLRNENDFTVKLPVFGQSFNGVDNPYSLIWSTKDIQELSNIVHYHRELMLALAGVKGIVMDKAQKPDDMTEKEWLYYRKQGITFINSLQRKHGKFPTYNQFQTYDDSVSASIQYMDNILVGFQKLVDEITGVSYQRKGQTINTDQVGTTESAIAQSVLTTEILFYEHDETARRALEEWLNLTKASLEKGGLFSYDEKGQETIVSIPENIFKDKRFRIGVETSPKDAQAIEDLKQISMQAYARGQLALDNLIRTYSIENLVELEKTIIKYAEDAAKNAELYETNKAEAEKQAEMEKIKFEKEYDAKIAENENQFKELEIQLKQAELELKNRELKLKEFVEAKGIELKDKDIASERDVELTYLQEENRSSRVDEALRMIELRLNAIFQDKQLEYGHAETMKKLSVDEKKANSNTKEQIKN